MWKRNFEDIQKSLHRQHNINPGKNKKATLKNTHIKQS